jgi:TonB family protein
MITIVSAFAPRRCARSLSFSLALASSGLGLVIVAHEARAASAAEESLVADGAALVRAWVPPVYPAEALKARRSGMVTLRLIIDENGKLTAARALEDSDAEFVAAALAAANEWEFAAAIEQGKSVASCVDTLVTFSPAVGQQKRTNDRIPPQDLVLQPAPRSSPKAKETPSGDYPEVLVERQLAGVVRFSCVVGADGRVLNPRIRVASHVDFVLPALRALERWEFTPAMQGDLVTAAPVDATITFDSIANRPEDVLAANGITAADGTVPAITPLPLAMTDPVWPLEVLLKGDGGSAMAEFTVHESGSIRDVRVVEASAPEFGHALVAALEASVFERPMASGRTTSVTLAKRAEFKAVPLDLAADADALARVVTALRAGSVQSAKGLDGKLVPLYRVAPTYPAALKEGGSPAGRAEIDFVIDREGRARLPRIVSATHEEFGWAAATAIAQWVFQAPTRGGEPTEVKVRIPFDFAPPAG